MEDIHRARVGVYIAKKDMAVFTQPPSLSLSLSLFGDWKRKKVDGETNNKPWLGRLKRRLNSRTFTLIVFLNYKTTRKLYYTLESYLTSSLFHDGPAAHTALPLWRTVQADGGENSLAPYAATVQGEEPGDGDGDGDGDGCDDNDGLSFF